MPDLITMGGEASGEVAMKLLHNNMDPNCLRPWRGQDGRFYQNRYNPHTGLYAAVPTNNATLLRKDDWLLLDRVVHKAAKSRLNAVADLRSRGLQFVIPNGMSKTVLQVERESDISAATVSMDGMRESEKDRPSYDTVNLPLPIIHKDFEFSARQLAASRTGGSPLDTTTAELAARKVAEEIEKLLLGVSSSYAYGGGTIYGYKNFTNRLTKTDITDPTTSGWTGATLVTEVLQMRDLAHDAYHYGPWVLYYSPDWAIYMDADYSSSKGDNTLADRLKKISGIEDVKQSDLLGTGYILVMVQMTPDVARMVVGMEIQTVQWESKGGMLLHFKVMGIIVPQLRADSNSNTGIVHGTTS